MKPTTKITLFSLLLLFNLSQAQRKNIFNSYNTEAGVNIASNGVFTATALNGVHYWSLLKSNSRFKIGLGTRLTSSFGGKSALYITAPAKLTSGKTGPGVFFAPSIPNNIDTLTVSSTQINALNLYLALRYDFTSKIGVEFNIDCIGMSFGAKKQASLAYGDQVKGSIASTAKPHVFNALLVSDNDLGSLNSELIVSYKYSSSFKIKAGFSFLFNEYVFQAPISYTNSLGTVINNSRYRTKSFMFTLGGAYIFNKIR